MWNEILLIIVFTLLAPLLLAIRRAVMWDKFTKNDLIFGLLAGFVIAVGGLIYRSLQ